MRYIAALDYEHLDNGVFLSTLAQSLSQQQQKDVRPIIVHSDSEYTERIIQTGVMRDEATIRSIKDLNNRLVALLADQGVSTISINPYQRDFITYKDDTLHLDSDYFSSLPPEPVLLLSTLVQDLDNNRQVAINLPRMVSFLYEQLNAEELFIFIKSDESEIFTEKEIPDSLAWDTMDSNFRKQQIPDDFRNFSHPVKLITARDFNQIPDLGQSIPIHSATQK